MTAPTRAASPAPPGSLQRQRSGVGTPLDAQREQQLLAAAIHEGWTMRGPRCATLSAPHAGVLAELWWNRSALVYAAGAINEAAAAVYTLGAARRDRLASSRLAGAR